MISMSPLINQATLSVGKRIVPSEAIKETLHKVVAQGYKNKTPLKDLKNPYTNFIKKIIPKKNMPNNHPSVVEPAMRRYWTREYLRALGL